MLLIIFRKYFLEKKRPVTLIPFDVDFGMTDLTVWSENLPLLS